MLIFFEWLFQFSVESSTYGWFHADIYAFQVLIFFVVPLFVLKVLKLFKHIFVHLTPLFVLKICTFLGEESDNFWQVKSDRHIGQVSA